MVAGVFKRIKLHCLLRLSLGSYSVTFSIVYWLDEVTMLTEMQWMDRVYLLKGGTVKSHCRRALPQGDKVHLETLF